MNPLAHTVIGELLRADFDMHDQLPTITLHLQQRALGYTHQRIIALRSYPGTPSARTQALFDHAALRCGLLYRVSADAVSSTANAVYMLGVHDVQRVTLPPPVYLDARRPAAVAHTDTAAGLALSLPASLSGHRSAR